MYLLNENIYEKTLMLLKKKLEELIVQIDPLMYQKYITNSYKVETILYVRISKALYRLLQSAWLFNIKLRTELGGFGFAVNPYNLCVANKMIKFITNDCDLACW